MSAVPPLNLRSLAENSDAVVAGRPSRLALVDAPAAWLRPVGVQRGIRVRARSAASPSWLAVVG